MICRSAQISHRFKAFLKANRIICLGTIKEAGLSGLPHFGQRFVQLRLTRQLDLLFNVEVLATQPSFDGLHCNFYHAGLPLKQRLMYDDDRLPWEHLMQHCGLQSVWR